MRKTFLLSLLLCALLGASAAPAADPADIAFWSSVANSRDPAELRAYLHAFPHGQFVEIAKIKLQELENAPHAPAPPQVQSGTIPPASITPTRSVWRAIDRIELDVDASNLGAGSNHRLIVVPAGTPDAVGDVNLFSRESIPIDPELLHMSLPEGPVGDDQIRLLYIPQFGNRFVVAARARIRVLPGAPGAVTAEHLAREAALIGPVALEVKYQYRTITVEGQFLHAEARTTFAGWDRAGRYQQPQKYVELYLGALSTPVTADGPPSQVVCLMAIGSGTLRHVTSLKPGDDVVVTGTPSTWDEYFGLASVIFDGCQFAP